MLKLFACVVFAPTLLLFQVSSAIAQNVVTQWSEIAARALTANRPPGSSGVMLGIVHAAIYDAVIAIEGGYEGFFTLPEVTKPASTRAAVASVAYRMLKARLPADQPALDQAYRDTLSSLPDDKARANGVEVGERVARIHLAMRQHDGLDNDVAYEQRPRAAGAWEPTAPPPATPVDIRLATAKPLVLESADQFRPAPPPELTSEVYRRDMLEVRRVGGKGGEGRTALETQTALFWSEHTGVQWSRTLRDLVIERRLGVPESARLLAMAHVAGADALIACFEAKYHYRSWRPMHAIQRSELDGAAAADRDWAPLLNVNHPEYPSAHSCWTAAVLTTLASYFGTQDVPFTMESTATNTSRRFVNVAQAMDECANARILAGLHFRYSVIAGSKLGENVARYVVARKFRPVAT